MIQAHPSHFMRQPHNYQKGGKAGVVITGEGQSSCWTRRDPRGLLLQKKKKQPPKKSSDLDVWVNHRAVKLALSTLPTLINWHLPAANPPGTASFTHALWQEDQTTKWMEARGARKSSVWWRRYSEGRSFHSTPQKKTKRQETFFLFFAQDSAGNSTHLTRFLQRVVSHWPICMLMKRNWSPLNSFCFKM